MIAIVYVNISSRFDYIQSPFVLLYLFFGWCEKKGWAITISRKRCHLYFPFRRWEIQFYSWVFNGFGLTNLKRKIIQNSIASVKKSLSENLVGFFFIQKWRNSKLLMFCKNDIFGSNLTFSSFYKSDIACIQSWRYILLINLHLDCYPMCGQAISIT